MTARAPLPEALARPPRGRVMHFAPHADDDVIGAGGTLCLHADQGDPVHVVIVFDGVRGDTTGATDATRYRDRRRDEARAAGAVLGLEDYDFCDYPEGHEPSDEELLHAARNVATLIAEFEPDLVYAPWIGEHHLDHHLLARVVRMALPMTPFRGTAWGYEVWTPLIPTRIVDVTSVHDKKVAALREHRSQLEAVQGMLHKALAISAQRAMYLDPEALHGEAFAPLGDAAPEDLRLVEPYLPS